MTINVEFLRTFLEVIDSGSLAKAAKKLCVTQSTVTTRLNILEERVAQKLLVREKSGVGITNAGFKFKTYAETIVRSWKQAQYALALPEACRFSLSIGYEYDLWNGQLEDWTDWFQTAHPQIALEFWAGPKAVLREWLASGLIDVALSFHEIELPKFKSVRISDDQLILISREPKEYRPGDINYIFIDWSDEFRRQHALVYKVNRATTLRFGEGRTALGYLLRNAGCAYFPLRMVSDQIERQELFVVEESPHFVNSIYLIHSDTVEKTDWFGDALDALREIPSACPKSAVTTRPYQEFLSEA